MSEGEETMMTVVGIVHEENGVFGVSFPDFPGCVTGADTLEEAIRKADEVLTFHVAGMVADGEPLPVLRNKADLDEDDTEPPKETALFLLRIQFDFERRI